MDTHYAAGMPFSQARFIDKNCPGTNSVGKGLMHIRTHFQEAEEVKNTSVPEKRSKKKATGGEVISDSEESAGPGSETETEQD